MCDSYEPDSGIIDAPTVGKTKQPDVFTDYEIFSSVAPFPERQCPKVFEATTRNYLA
jgi:hypothetical protein